MINLGPFACSNLYAVDKGRDGFGDRVYHLRINRNELSLIALCTTIRDGEFRKKVLFLIGRQRKEKKKGSEFTKNMSLSEVQESEAEPLLIRCDRRWKVHDAFLHAGGTCSLAHTSERLQGSPSASLDIRVSPVEAA
ncbi:hypothetical protein RND71_025515 [Anisodus tanguticus]|uniref:Uncharacterized protein n=1 Tax=Anisodus tanguticus TaxID=243964 RepID=A0AAE1VCR4_9SOLA|nr:hypothetical protein RND71_025515 [Anisodus tanguticus]